MVVINKKVGKSWVVALKIRLLMPVSEESEIKVSTVNHRHLLGAYPALLLVHLCIPHVKRMWCLGSGSTKK